MTDTPATPLPPLAPDATITRANLAQALAEIIAKLPDITKPGVAERLKAGDLYSNDGALALALKD